MSPLDLPPKEASRLKRDQFGWYVAGDLNNDELADLVCDMMETPYRTEKLRLAHEILERAPENIEALTTVGRCAASLSERLVILRQAVMIGTRAWARALEGKIEIFWWLEIGTRPYMRAINAYGEALLEAGRTDDAERCFETLARMRRGDLSLGEGQEREPEWAAYA